MADSTAEEIKAAQQARREQKQQRASEQRPDDQLGLSSKSVSMDLDVYEGGGKRSRFANHDTSIAVGGTNSSNDGHGDENNELDDDGNQKSVRLLDSCEYSPQRQSTVQTTSMEMYN